MKVLKYLLIGILTLTLLFFSIGLIKPEVNYSNEVTINKSVAESFAIFIDPEQMDHWVPGFKSIEVLEGMPNMVGSRYKLVVVENGEEYEIIETINRFEENEAISIRLENDVLINEVNVTFLPLNGKTKIITLNSTKGKGMFMKSVLTLMKGQLIKQANESYKKLKQLVENQ